ncbi:MAG: hypothetical protein ACI81S_001652 [Sphingobacteriales bacterium]|jgi:hypothetical protein
MPETGNKSGVYKSKDFNPSDSPKYSLSMLLRQDGLSFSITGQDELLFHQWIKYAEGRSFISELEKEIAKNVQLNLDFHSVRVVLEDFPSALFPIGTVPESRYHDVLPFGSWFNHREKLTYLKSVVTPNEIESISLVPERIESAISQFKNLEVNTIYGRISALAEGKTSFNIYRSAHQIHIVYIKDGKLMLANGFDCTVGSEAVYFTVAVCNQFGLEPENTPLTLWGEVRDYDSIYLSLKDYYSTIEFGNAEFEVPSNLFLESHQVAIYL